MHNTRKRFTSPVMLWAAVILAVSACVSPAAVPTPPATLTVAPPTATTLPATATSVPPTPTTVPTTATAAIALPESTATSSADAGVPATTFRLTTPPSIAFAPDGKLYISECAELEVGERLYVVDLSGMLKLFSGVGEGFSGDGGPAIAASYWCPNGIAFDQAGNLYVADVGNNRIRRIDPQGTITTVVGSGPTVGDAEPLVHFAGDGGPADEARLWGPTDIAFDAQGNLYILDSLNLRVRKVDQAGIITTIAGNGTNGFSGDGGPGAEAQLALQLHTAFGGPPMGIAADAAGNVYFADYGNSRIRRVDANGMITTIAGIGGDAGFAGDGGPATKATLSRPNGLAFDADGNLYFSDGPDTSFFGCRVRRIDLEGTITTVAGAGECYFEGDGGPANAALLRAPADLAFDAAGNLYIADQANNLIRMVDQNGIITSVAGGGF